MLNFKPIALVGGIVVCAVGFLLFIPMITEIIYKSESWQSYTAPILLYLIVGGSLVITNRNVELKISTKEAFIITVLSWLLLAILCAVPAHTALAARLERAAGRWGNRVCGDGDDSAHCRLDVLPSQPRYRRARHLGILPAAGTCVAATGRGAHV